MTQKKSKLSRAKRIMLEDRKRPRNYDGESLRKAYEEKTGWIAKAEEKEKSR